MKKAVAIALVGLSAGLYGGVSLANTNTGQAGSSLQISIPSSMNLTLDRQMMYAAPRDRRGMRGGRGGGRGMRGRGGRRAGWHGRRGWHGHRHHRDHRYYRRGGYYNNWGWAVPAAIATGALISASQSSGQSAYACQARYRGYWYQGRYRPGGPCYINIGGRVIGISNFQAPR